MTDVEATRLPLLLVDLLPVFATELTEALRAEDNALLADQLATLPITEFCGCGDDFCSSFYTGPRPDGAWGPGHRNVSPATTSGMVVLDVVDDLIRYVEVLDRHDVKAIVSALPG